MTGNGSILMVSLQCYFDPAHPPVAGIDAIRGSIRDRLLTTSRYIQTPNFVRCGDSDLKILFDGYDSCFFDAQLRSALETLNAWPIDLRFSGRLRSTGGRTTRTTCRKSRHVTYSIQISSNVLFTNFRTPEETASVNGLICPDRVDAMMRVMEHELLHLAEFLAFNDSTCTGGRFQHAAMRMFGHTEHTHAMVSKRVKTLLSTDLRPGHRVRFSFEGKTLTGVINRINARATVLVEDPRGARYNDGRKYVKFYMPLALLQAA
jgi:hypothetical protein